MKINIKKLNPEAIIPTRGSVHAAGYDLYTIQTSTIAAGQTEKIGTGVAMEIPDGYVGLVYARSGLATKQGLRPANCVGVIDSDYRGEIIVALHNDSDVERVVNEGERVAQIVIAPYLQVEFNEVDNLEETERSDNGFGSTGN